MFTRLPILLAQIKARNNSRELKNEIRQLLYSLYRSKQIYFKKKLNRDYLKMETIFMNTANSKAKHSNKFVYNFTDKLNLKNPNKNIALANLSIYYTWKMLNQIIITINLKYQHPRGMIRLTCLMVLFQFLLFKIILNTL